VVVVGNGRVIAAESTGPKTGAAPVRVGSTHTTKRIIHREPDMNTIAPSLRRAAPSPAPVHSCGAGVATPRVTPTSTRRWTAAIVVTLTVLFVLLGLKGVGLGGLRAPRNPGAFIDAGIDAGDGGAP